MRVFMVYLKDSYTTKTVQAVNRQEIWKKYAGNVSSIVRIA
jgi:hypothetical protein